MNERSLIVAGNLNYLVGHPAGNRKRAQVKTPKSLMPG